MYLEHFNIYIIMRKVRLPSKYTIVKVIERFAVRLLFNEEMENLAADLSESNIFQKIKLQKDKQLATHNL